MQTADSNRSYKFIVVDWNKFWSGLCHVVSVLHWPQCYALNCEETCGWFHRSRCLTVFSSPAPNMPQETKYPYLHLATSGKMNNEPCRLKSFGDPSWSQNCSLSCLSLDKEGLYYTGKDAEVRCFKCGLQLDGRQDRIREVRAAHRARAPGCPFRDEDLCGPCNIPLPVYSAKGQAANAIKAYLGIFYSRLILVKHETFKPF